MHVAILFIIMDYKLIMESWRIFSEQVRRTQVDGEGAASSTAVGDTKQDTSLDAEAPLPDPKKFTNKPKNAQRKNRPLKGDTILALCKKTWDMKALSSSYNKSVRGMPSAIQLVFKLSKDKDILATASELGNKDFVLVRHVMDGGGNEEDGDFFKGTLATAGAVNKEKDKDHGLRVMRLNWQQLTSQAHRQASAIVGGILMMHDAYVAAYNENPGENWIFKNGIVSREKIQNFINFFGLMSILSVSSTLVHEIAHLYDPDNLWNRVGGDANARWDSLDKIIPSNIEKLSMLAQAWGSTVTPPVLMVRQAKKLRDYYLKKAAERPDKMKNALSGAVEMFAINRETDYVNHLLSNKFITSLDDSKAAFGSPRKKPNKFGMSSWVATIPLIKGASEKKTNEGSQNFQAALDAAGEMILRNIKNTFRVDNSQYAIDCTARLGAKNDDGEALAMIAQGDHEDRFSIDSLEDRASLQRSREEQEKAMKLQALRQKQKERRQARARRLQKRRINERNLSIKIKTN